MSTDPSLCRPTPLPGGAAEQLDALEHELLRAVGQRALRQMLESTSDRPALLAQLRRELEAALGGRAGPASPPELLLAEFEALFDRLEAAPSPHR
ncbi:hypothetical protein QMO56_14765 [Roseomonas sp. E05]|uniref:hypothetical protein n=1 Tax=Roseomonas sp. E05 TaxID=3046310 RepID=UPI0024BADBA3|nr:hypothetical protein [Roseomonas sp. E05]MDJ0389379.1 hypothetical protein [Roseomonas sp. E05]